MSYYNEKNKELKECKRAFEIDDPFCCTPRIDTFLAETTVKPFGLDRPGRTEEEKREIELGLVECLHYPILWDDITSFGDEEEVPIHEKLNRVNKHLDYLYKQKELLENNENKKEELQKLEREIKHFLIKRESVLYEQKKMASLDNTSDIPYSKDSCQNMKEEIEGQRENLNHKILKKCPINNNKKCLLKET